jgi:hypothetical protein
MPCHMKHTVIKGRMLHQELIAIEQELFTQLGLHFKVGVVCIFCNIVLLLTTIKRHVT